MISAILLAAGTSSRLGKPKQLLPLGDSTIIERVIESLREAKLVEIIVVLGHASEEIASRIEEDEHVKVVVNPDYEEGMASSIRCGMRHVGAHMDGYLIVLGDKPLLDTDTVNQVIDKFYNCKKKIVVPTYEGQRGHPIVLSPIYKEELTALTGDVGARELLAVHADEVLEFTVDTDAVLVDVDTLDDYNQLIRKLDSSDGG